MAMDLFYRGCGLSPLWVTAPLVVRKNERPANSNRRGRRPSPRTRTKWSSRGR